MSIWTDISEFLGRITADAFSSVVENLRTLFEGDVETRRRVAFSVALIALSAKMAKADGVVSEAEVRAFRRVFDVPPGELKNVFRLYNLAKQDVAGFDAYSRQVRSLFPGDDEADKSVLCDVLEALFHIAKADEVIHDDELLFLEKVAQNLGFGAAEFEAVKLRHVAPTAADPYQLLEADPSWPFEELKSHYRRRVKDSHPDRLIARGVPREFIVIANERLASLNAAWEKIERIHQRAPALA